MDENVDLASFAAERDPPTATCRWDPGGVVCASCGERTEWAWGEEPRCPSCKPWSV